MNQTLLFLDGEFSEGTSGTFVASEQSTFDLVLPTRTFAPISPTAAPVAVPLSSESPSLSWLPSVDISMAFPQPNNIDDTVITMVVTFDAFPGKHYWVPL